MNRSKQASKQARSWPMTAAACRVQWGPVQGCRAALLCASVPGLDLSVPPAPTWATALCHLHWGWWAAAGPEATASRAGAVCTLWCREEKCLSSALLCLACFPQGHWSFERLFSSQSLGNSVFWEPEPACCNRCLWVTLCISLQLLTTSPTERSLFFSFLFSELGQNSPAWSWVSGITTSYPSCWLGIWEDAPYWGHCLSFSCLTADVSDLPS